MHLDEPSAHHSAAKKPFDGTFDTLQNEVLRKFGKEFRSCPSYREDGHVSYEDFIATLAAFKLNLDDPANKTVICKFTANSPVCIPVFLEQLRVDSP